MINICLFHSFGFGCAFSSSYKCIIWGSENVFPIRRTKLPSSVSFPQLRWGGPVLSHLFPPQHLHTPPVSWGVSLCASAECSLQDRQESPGWGGARLPQWLFHEVAKVLTLSSPVPPGERWRSSRAKRKQSCRKYNTTPAVLSLCSVEINFTGVSVLSHLASGRSFNC